jgi:hypothetical protein
MAKNRFAREQAQQEWDTQAPLAYALRDDLLRGFRFAFRRDGYASQYHRSSRSSKPTAIEQSTPPCLSRYRKTAARGRLPPGGQIHQTGQTLAPPRFTPPCANRKTQVNPQVNALNLAG